MKNIARSVYQMYKAGGMRRLWHEISESYLFDVVNNTDTHTRVPIQNYSSSTDKIDSAYQYMPAFTSLILSSIKKIINIDNSVLNSEFIDIGSGKGKALIIANKLGFINGTGYEINSDLCEIGNKNLQLVKASKFKILNQNAVNPKIIPDFRVCYFYNPFNKQMTKKFIKIIEGKKSKNKKFLIYINPLYSYLLKENWILLEQYNVGTQLVEIWSI